MAITVNMGFVAAAGGTVDAITATYAPVPPSLYNGLLLWFVSIGANTVTNPTFNPNGLGIRTIVKKGGQPLIAGDIGAAGFVAQVEYNLANTRWELLNPANVVANSMTTARLLGRSTAGTGAVEEITLGTNLSFTGTTLNATSPFKQMVNATNSVSATSTTSAWADTGLSATITPSSASSKILILVNMQGCYKDTNDTCIVLRLLRGAATVVKEIEGSSGRTGSAAINGIGGNGGTFEDSPATVAATTYKVQFASNRNAANVYINGSDSGFVSTSSMTLIEYLP